MNARNQFNCINQSADPAADTIGHRAQTITHTALLKISALPDWVKEIVLGTVVDRLRGIPFEDFDQTRKDLAKFIAKHGCAEVVVKGDRYRLSELAVQMDSAAEALAPFRKALEEAK